MDDWADERVALSHVGVVEAHRDVKYWLTESTMEPEV